MGKADDRLEPGRPTTTPRPVPLAWRVLAALTFLIVAFHDVTGLGNRRIAVAAQGLIGGAIDNNYPDKGFSPVLAVRPGGPLDRAGVRPGDPLRFDRWADSIRTTFPAGQTVPFTFRHDGVTRHGQVVAEARPPPPLAPGILLVGSAELLLLAIGGLIAARNQARRASFVLGAALICLALSGSAPSPMESAADGLLPVTVVLLAAIFGASPILLLAFAREQRREARGSPDGPVWRWMFWIGVTVQAGLCVATFIGNATLQGPPGVNLFVCLVIWGWLMLAQALAVLLAAWRENEGEVRTRFGFLALAYALIVTGLLGMGLYINLTGNDWTANNPAVLLDGGLTITGSLVFAYAILRHRIVDLGFVVNRTLVYGALSTVLLILFGFAEWAIGKLIPREAAEANVLFSAGIALAIFLFFHHVQDWIEKAVEHVFFRTWRENEAQLQRFVRNAAHFTHAEALRAAAVGEFTRFAGGAEVALYRREPGGYGREQGSVARLPAVLEPDLPMIVRLRAEQTPLDAELPDDIALVLPLNHRNELMGFFVLGAKPSQDSYRPDEIALLAEAAAKIGLDLHALRVEALEIESQEQRRRADILESQLQRGLARGSPA